MAEPRWGPWERCEMSGEVQMLAWPPDLGYPGAVVCIGCSYGVLVRKGSAHRATSKAGFDGWAGIVLTHEVRRRPDPHSSNDATEMRYPKR